MNVNLQVLPVVAPIGYHNTGKIIKIPTTNRQNNGNKNPIEVSIFVCGIKEHNKICESKNEKKNTN